MIKDFLEQRHKEFEEKFTDQWWASTDGRNDKRQEILLSFHDQTVLMLLEKVREEMESRLDNSEGYYTAALVVLRDVLNLEELKK